MPRETALGRLADGRPGQDRFRGGHRIGVVGCLVREGGGWRFLDAAGGEVQRRDRRLHKVDGVLGDRCHFLRNLLWGGVGRGGFRLQVGCRLGRHFHQLLLRGAEHLVAKVFIRRTENALQLGNGPGRKFGFGDSAVPRHGIPCGILLRRRIGGSLHHLLAVRALDVLAQMVAADRDQLLAVIAQKINR